MKLIVLIMYCAIMSGCFLDSGAEKRFKERKGPFSVTVYPVNVFWKGSLTHQPELAEQIITFFKDENLALPVASENAAEYEFKWSRIQSTMARRSSEGFAEFVKKQSLTTDYALLVDILMTKSGRSVACVHVYLVEKGGLGASFGLTNSKWEEFKKVRPTSREKGVLISTMMMKRMWGK